MRIIDFHTHIFPDRIAEKTIRLLAENCQEEPQTQGTKESLLSSMKEADIDCSIILPVVTDPSQIRSVHRFAAEFCKEPLISFGGIHPDCENYREILRMIRDMGFAGIKLHPDYQNAYIDDIRYKRIISYATELGLIITVHAGIDPKTPEDVHCPPDKAAKVIQELEPDKLILAHMGGNGMYDEAEEYLIGAPVWLDTAYVLDKIPQEQFLRMIKNHGTKKILFATDSPWGSQRRFVDYMKKLPLTEEERHDILYRNAETILGKRE